MIPEHSQEVVAMRAEILVNYNKEYYKAYKYVDMSQIHQRGTTAYKYYAQRNMIMPQLVCLLIKNEF